MGERRVYVGGLGEDISEGLLLGRFAGYPGVEAHSAEFVHRELTGQTFAYVQVTAESDEGLAALCKAYDGAKWRGQRLRMAVAKPTFEQRLAAERAEAAAAKAAVVAAAQAARAPGAAAAVPARMRVKGRNKGQHVQVMTTPLSQEEADARRKKGKVVRRAVVRRSFRSVAARAPVSVSASAPAASASEDSDSSLSSLTSSSESEGEEEEREEDGEQQPPAKDGSSWLGMDDDESESDTGSDARPSGFDGDERFRLDDRFVEGAEFAAGVDEPAEEEEEEEEKPFVRPTGDAADDDEDEDGPPMSAEDVQRSMAAELSSSLNILESMFPGTVTTSRPAAAGAAKRGFQATARFDPSNPEASQLLAAAEGEGEETETVAGPTAAPAAPTERRIITDAAGLKGAFGAAAAAADAGSFAFSFGGAAVGAAEEAEEEAEDFADKDGEDEEMPTVIYSAPREAPAGPAAPVFVPSTADESLLFVRVDSEQEAHERWLARRRRLTTDFKRKQQQAAQARRKRVRR